jgi:hypothetical protein
MIQIVNYLTTAVLLNVLMSIFSTQRHCRLKHSGDVRVVIGLKEGGTVEERFMIDDGSSGEAESASAAPGRAERSGTLSLVMQGT